MFGTTRFRRVPMAQRGRRWHPVERLVSYHRRTHVVLSSFVFFATNWNIVLLDVTGQKRIVLLDSNVTVPTGGLTIQFEATKYSILPAIKYFGVFAPCRTQ